MRDQRGFTLIELMIALVLGVILMTLAVPSFRSTIQNNRATAAANDILTALNAARSEAIKRGTPMTICSSSNGSSCAASTDWSTGWILFSDLNSNGVLDDNGTPPTCQATEDCLIRSWEGLKGNPSFTGTTLARVTYNANGSVTAAGQIVIALPECKGDQKRQISITATGQASVSSLTCP